MDEFQPLDNDEVLFVSLGRVLMANPTFKVGEFLDALAQAISDREEDWVEENEGWFNDGLDCQALRFSGQGWQRGRVRIRLEFSPDSPKARLPERRMNEQPRRLGKLEPRSDAPPGLIAMISINQGDQNQIWKTFMAAPMMITSP